MTKEDWEYVKTRWGVPYATICFMVDGYKLGLSTRRDGMSLVMLVFVDGFSRGEWLVKTSSGEWRDEARRFLQTRSRQVYSSKSIKTWEGILGKRKCRAEGIYAKVESKQLWWKSFHSFKRHLIAHNESIELI